MKFTIFNKTITVTIIIESSLKNRIKKLCNEERWLDAMKLYKHEKNCSLKEAKDYIDNKYRFNPDFN